jgi:hypothetical protein
MNKIVKKNTIILFIAILLIIFSSLACGSNITLQSTQNSSNPTDDFISTTGREILPTDTLQPNQDSRGFPDPMFTMIPYNYTLEDIGDGWNRGKILLAFENRTSTTLNINDPIKFPSGIIVETKEGVTYPASLDSLYISENYASAYIAPFNNLLDFSPFYLIPPGFRFASIFDDANGFSLEYGIVWKSAVAATPTRILFNDFPELSFELPEQNINISFPYDYPPEFSSLTSLKDTTIFDENSIKVTFTGKCGNAVYYGYPGYENSNSNKFFLEFLAQNQDLYNQHDLEFYFPLSAFYTDTINPSLQGWVWVSPGWFSSEPNGDETNRLLLGPGQSSVLYVKITKIFSRIIDPPIVVLWGFGDIGYQVIDPEIHCIIGQ